MPNRHLAPLLAAALLSALPVAVLAESTADRRTPASADPAPAGAERGPAGVFEPNRGQCDPEVRFLARGAGFTAWLTRDGAVFAGPSAPGEPAPLFRMNFVGGGGGAALEGEDPTGGASNYLVGRDPAGWRKGIPHFRGVLARNAYRGIDVRWRHAARGTLRYDLLVGADADVSEIALDFGAGARALVRPDGSLEVRTRTGAMGHSAPRLWQEAEGRRLPVEGAFALRRDGKVGFRVGRHDRRLPLVVDPAIDFSTFLGGTGLEGYIGADMAVGPAGEVFVTGDTRSKTFPPKDAIDIWSGGVSDGFVTKLAPKGNDLAFSTFFGGNQYDEPASIAIGPSGSAVVYGRTNSSDFPVTAGVLRTTYNSFPGLFLLRLKGDGTAFDFSTYLGWADEKPGDLAVDAIGDIYVTGWAASDWKSTPGAAQTYQSDTDAIVAKIAADGKSFHWSSFIGGNTFDAGSAIAVGPDGAVYVAGNTNSTDFASAGAFKTAYSGGYRDAFVVKVNPGGGSFAWRTYLGGDRDDEATGIAVDSKGRVVVTGFTDSNAGFPVKDPLYPRQGMRDVFLTRLDATGNADFSTHLGGTGEDFPANVAIDARDGIVLCGATTSTNFPLIQPYQPALGNVANDQDAFLSLVASDGKSMQFSTYLGGSGYDAGRAVAVDGGGAILVAGTTSSSNFPFKAGYQEYLSGSDDFFLTKFLLIAPPKDLTATVVSSSQIDLQWIDASDNEGGFEISRRVGAGEFLTIAEVAPGTTAWSYQNAVGSKTYGFRVRAVNAEAKSTWTNEAVATTPPGPPGAPEAPADLTVVLDDQGVAHLEWSDLSESEDFFQVFRRVEGGAWGTLATTNPDATTFADASLLPDRTYDWRVRSGNSGGFSNPTGTVTAMTPPTLDATITRGSVVDSPKFGKDSLLLTGTAAVIGGGAADLVALGLEIRLGGWNGQQIAAVPANDPGWKISKKKATLKSPKGALFKTKLTVDLATGAFTLKLSRWNLVAPPGTGTRISVTTGTYAGTETSDWVPGKPGRWAHP